MNTWLSLRATMSPKRFQFDIVTSARLHKMLAPHTVLRAQEPETL